MVNRVIKQTNDQIRTLARGCQLVAPFILAITREFMSRRSLARLLVVFIGKSGWYIGWYICNWKMSQWAKKEVLFSQMSTKIIPPEGHLLIHPKLFVLDSRRQQFWHPRHSVWEHNDEYEPNHIQRMNEGDIRQFSGVGVQSGIL